MSEPEDKIYLEERKLVRRYSPLTSVLVNTLFLFVVFYASWWIFQDPRGLMRMYTPYVGYMWCRWLLVVIISWSSSGSHIFLIFGHLKESGSIRRGRRKRALSLR